VEHHLAPGPRLPPTRDARTVGATRPPSPGPRQPRW
jgi:hypothetical protein